MAGIASALLLTAAAAQDPGSLVVGRPLAVVFEAESRVLGDAGGKTVVELTAAIPSGRQDAETRRALEATPFTVEATISGGGGVLASVARPLPPPVPSEGAESWQRATLLYALRPGTYRVRFRLLDASGNRAGERSIDLEVPETAVPFRALPAVEGRDLPPAEAVALEAGSEIPGGAGEERLWIRAPAEDFPLGKARLEVEASRAVARVEAFLDGKKVAGVAKRPFRITVDLGTVARRQTLTIVGYDATGRALDTDAWVFNERRSRLAVRILETAGGPPAARRFRVAVTAPAGAVIRSVSLFVDDEAVARWTEPPLVAEIPAARLKSAVLLRAVAVDGDGNESTALTVPGGEARFVASEEVRLVELSVSVLGEDGRLVRGLSRDDFVVLEDGLPQEIQAFETARTLPLLFGLALDRSASMREAMSVAKETAAAFLEGLLQGPDRAFVLAFDTRPELLTGWTRRPSEAAAALGRVVPAGGTALHDAIVLCYYQLRGVPGRKAVVVVTDGFDEHSRLAYGPARRYVESAGLPLFLVGLGTGGAFGSKPGSEEVRSWRRLRDMALASGGDAISISSEKDLSRVFATIETELRSQYFLSYVSGSRKGEDAFRSVEVKLRDPKLKAKTIRGYFP